ncbi:MAG: LuxR C-terminal-related transcriptional regulator [Parvularculaceae bacterium]|nr:LuxR C-terminal-related transcriptional regulator [Parvularculaceae bacterium]
MTISFEDVLDKAIAASSARSVLQQAQDAFGAAGFDTVLYYQIQHNFEQVNVSQGARLTGWPHLPRPVFESQTVFDFDPVVADRIATLEPFRWSDVSTDPQISQPLLDALEEYREAGFADAVMVPESVRAGNMSVFVLTGKNARFDLTRRDLLMLQHIGLALHRRFEELEERAPQSRLSPRELEVMKLAAVGKTNAEIAEMLSISVHTVSTLVRRSYVKLGANNRVQASIKLSYLNRRRA